MCRFELAINIADLRRETNEDPARSVSLSRQKIPCVAQLVEAGVVENAVQLRGERMARRDWQVGGRHPQRSLLARATPR